MDIKLVLDIIVAILLIATISYSVSLNRRLTQLRKNRDEMAKMVIQFNEATARAESSIPKLRKAAEDAGAALAERVEKAQSLRDDLAFMVERADSIADRLENSVRTAREARPAAAAPNLSAAAPSPSPAAKPAAGGRPLTANREDGFLEDEPSEAERELLRAMQMAR